MTYTIYHTLEINATTSKIFQAITEPKHLENWWPSKCEGVPVKNEVYNFFFTPEYDWYGKVIKVEKDKAFYIKMTKSDRDWDPTTFGFDLEQKTGIVQLKFWHKGWPSCNDHFKKSSFSWAMLLNGLKFYMEKDEIVPFAKRD